MKKIVIVLCVLGFTLTSIGGCTKTLSDNACDVKNPLTDLEWLSQIVKIWEENSQNGFGTTARIYQCTYEKNKIGFLIEPCVGCPDAGYSFRSFDGTILCGGGGIDGKDSCETLNIDFANKRLIYKLN